MIAIVNETIDWDEEENGLGEGKGRGEGKRWEQEGSVKSQQKDGQLNVSTLAASTAIVTTDIGLIIFSLFATLQ